MSTAGWLTGCGRLWFDTSKDTPGGGLADAPPADPPVDSPTGAPADATVDAAPIDAIAGPAPHLDVMPMLSMDVACGSTPQTTILTVTNSGNAALTISDATVTGDPFVLKLFPLVIAPGASGDFPIEPPTPVIGTDLGGSVKRATLKIESNDRTVMVGLEATIIGANIIMTPPSPLDFTSSSGTCPPPKPFSVTNTGNQAIVVASAIESPFAGSSSNAFLAPGASLVVNVRPVTTQCSGTGNVGFTASSGTICTVDPVVQVNLDIRGASTGCSCS